MKTIILCGGMGTRLKEETEFKPKPMVHVGDKPIIWHIMKIYSHFGFNEFVLALGYKADYIKDFFLNQKAFTTNFTLQTKSHKTKFYLTRRETFDDFTITFVDTGLDTAIGERILRCRDYIPSHDKYFMVTYGDGVANVDIKDAVTFHKKQKTIGTIVGVHPRTKYGLVTTGQNNLVSSIKEKPILNQWVNGGFMIFDKKVFDYIHNEQSELQVLENLAKLGQISMYKHPGFWFAVDTYKEYEDLNKLWMQKNPPWKVWD